MVNENLEFQMKFIKTCLCTNVKDYRIFLSDENLHDYISKQSKLGNRTPVLINNSDFFKNYTEKINDQFYPSWIKPEDSNFYLVNLKSISNLEDKKDLITTLKRWVFYGKGIDYSSAYLLAKKKDFELVSFEEELKLENIVLDMANLWNLEILFEKFKKN